MAKASQTTATEEAPTATSYNWRTGLFVVATLGWLACMPGINVYHHLELPSIDQYKYTITSNYRVGLTGLHKQTDIRLSGEIKDPGYYETIANVLEQAQQGDTVIFHLAGPGGDVDGCYYLINAIKSSKANVIMSVEAPAYSADAYLAVNGTSNQALIMAPYSYLMFHFSSVLNLDCSTAGGTDRGTPNNAHCEAFKDISVSTTVTFLENVDLLTAKEKSDIFTGHDVYLSAEQVKERQQQLAKDGTLQGIPSYQMPTGPAVQISTPGQASGQNDNGGSDNGETLTNGF